MMNVPPTLLQTTVYFTGTVQGVGFRYATYQAAKEFEVTGKVENLSDGRVLLVAEGAPAEVQAFLDVVIDRLDKFIRNVERQERTGVREYDHFRIH